MFDFINGCFEFCGFMFIVPTIYKTWADKGVMGIWIGQVAFFTVWGLWNLVYYPHLNQWFSLAGAVMVCLCNLIWLGQIVYYRRLS